MMRARSSMISCAAALGLTLGCYSSGSESESNPGSSGGGSGGGNMIVITTPPEKGTQQYLELCARYGLGAATRLALDPAGEWLAVGGPDVVALFGAADGELVRRYELEGYVGSLEFSPDGGELAVAGPDTVYLFDTATAELRTSFEKPSENVFVPLAVRYSPAGDLLAVADVARVRIHSLPDAGVANDIDGSFSWASDRIDFADDGSGLLARVNEGVALVEPLSGVTSLPFEDGTFIHGAVASGPSGLVAEDGAGSIRVWQDDVFNAIQEIAFAGEADSLAFSRDGSLIAAAATDRDVGLHVWEVETGTQLLEQAIVGFLGDLLRGMSVRFGADNASVFVNNAYQGLGFALADPTTPTNYAWGHTDFFSDATISWNQQLLASSARDQVIVWNRADESIVTSMRPPGLDSEYGISGEVAFSPDDSKLYSTAQGTLFEWDATTGELLRPAVQLHQSMISELAVSPDGTKIAVGVFGNEFMVIDSATLEPLFHVAVPDSFADLAAISPDSSVFAGQKNETQFAVWDAQSGEELGTAEVGSDLLGGVFFAAGGTRLVIAAGYDVFVYAWPGLELVHRLQRHTAAVYGLMKVSDDRYVMSFGGDNQRVVLWDIVTGQAFSEGSIDDAGVPRVALPEGLEVALVLRRESGLRTYCNGEAAPPLYFPPPR